MAKLTADKAAELLKAVRARDLRLKNKYGIGVVEYNQMFVAQDRVCAICKRPPKNRQLAVDHDHLTGKVRGLLCFRCNKYLIGRYRDPTLFTRAAKYLSRKKALGL